MDHQKRFILAMVLSGIVLLVWQVFFAPTPPEQAPLPEEGVVERPVEADVAPPEEAAPRLEPGEPAPEAEAEAEPAPAPREIAPRQDVLASDWFRMELTNRGAAATSIYITQPDQYEKRGDLLNAFPEEARHYPFTVAFTNDNVAIPADARYEVVEQESTRAEDGTYSKLTYRYVDPRNRFALDKVFTVDPEQPYVVALDVRLDNRLRDVRLVDTLALDVFGHADHETEKNFLDFQPDELEAVCRLGDDTERSIIDKVESRMSFSEGGVIWGGIDTRYFLLGAIPANRAASCEIERLNEDYLRTRLVAEGFSVAPGQTYEASFTLYTGPKDFSVLQAVGHRLEESIDYGFFTVLARPLRWLLAFFHGFVGNWGLAIILLTVLIKLATWPINDKAYVNAERMKKIQPIIQDVKKKYENDQQRMTEETMKVFREHKVSPLGCLPMLIQIPILYGLFVMIYNSVELYQADFILWYQDLSAPDPYFILPILMGGIMVIQQGMMPTADGGNPQMKTMMKVMPIIFTAFMLFLPAGLVLYYLVNLILGLGQQVMIKRKFKKADEAA